MEPTFTTANLLSTEALGYWENFTKASVESGKQLESLNLKLAEKLMQKQAEFFYNTVDAGNQVAALLGEGKPLPEILAAQAKLASDYGSKLFAFSREASEIIIGSHEEYRNWFEQGFKRLTEQAETVASAVPKVVPRKAA